MVETLIITAMSSGVVTAFVTSWFGKRKTSAEAAEILNKSTLEWASEMKAEIKELKLEVERLANENLQLKEVILQLKTELEKCEDCPNHHGASNG